MPAGCCACSDLLLIWTARRDSLERNQHDRTIILIVPHINQDEETRCPINTVATLAARRPYRLRSADRAGILSVGTVCLRI